MFLDDIADAVKDTVKTVGEGVGKIGSTAFNTVLSPTESFAMGGLGAAASTVANVFGGVELFEKGIGGLDSIGHSNLPLAGLAGSLLGFEANVVKNGTAGNTPLELVQNFSGSVSKGEAFGNEISPFPKNEPDHRAELEQEKAKYNTMQEKEAEKQAREEANARANRTEDAHEKTQSSKVSRTNRARARFI